MGNVLPALGASLGLIYSGIQKPHQVKENRLKNFSSDGHNARKGVGVENKCTIISVIKIFIVVLLGCCAEKIRLIQMRIVKGFLVANSMYYFYVSFQNE